MESLKEGDRKYESQTILNFILIYHLIKIDFKVSKRNKLDNLRSIWDLAEAWGRSSNCKGSQEQLRFYKIIEIVWF